MKYKTNQDLKKHYKVITDNKMRAYGDTDLGKKVIRINKDKAKKRNRPGEVLDTIVHEAMHAKHPMMHEYTVRRKTKKLMKKLNKKQKRGYYKLVKGGE